MRVVISIGGSALAPDLDARCVEGHASVAEMLARDGREIGAVVGGGDVTRDYAGAARDLGANEIQFGQISIDVTRVNARLLITTLGSQVDPRIAHDYEDAGDAIRRGDISMMGGVMPGQTTDAVAAAPVEYVDADLLVYATSIDGVFSADPDSDPDATEFEEMTAAELVDVIDDIEMSAGSSAPVDLLAAKLIEHAKMRTIVLDGTDPDRITPAVPRGEHTGTDIILEGGDKPTYRVP